MKLKAQKETVIRVDYDELDQLIRDTYNQQGYEIIADMEWNNNESHSYKFVKEPLNQWQESDIEKFREHGKYLFSLPAIMQDMVNNGVLEEGNYIIDICY